MNDITTTTPPAALHLRDIGKRYDGRWVVHDVTLAVPAGEIAGILGHNGAGKSTVIRACAGWLRLDHGQVEVNGRIVCDSDLAARATLGVVSRDTPLYAFLSVREMVLFQTSLQGMAAAAGAAACARVLALCQLDAVAAQRISTLSSGMYQRVLLACALVHTPAVLLLDEPTTGLDPTVRQHVWAILRTLAAQGCAILLTTHYLEEAAQVCDAVYVLEHGALTQTMRDAAPAALLAALQGWFAKPAAGETCA